MDSEQIEHIKLKVEIDMRRANINKLGEILEKAKGTVWEGQSRLDYEHKRLHQATVRMKELGEKD